VTAERPLDDIVLEAQRLLGAAVAADVPVRLVGGLAVRAYAGARPVIDRTYKDIDLVTLKGRSKRVGEFMAEMGYEADRVFNTTNGHRRLLFYDPPNARQVDVFVGSFEMCHVVPITDRITLHREAVPLAELFLTKSQIVELNAKDQSDILTILYHHDVAESDGDGAASLNAARVAPDQREVVRDRLDRLWQRIESEPKSARWKLRARVGDKVRWYEEPEEVA
jgi:hypothetical protein